jgi:hypothetical protein
VAIQYAGTESAAFKKARWSRRGGCFLLELHWHLQTQFEREYSQRGIHMWKKAAVLYAYRSARLTKIDHYFVNKTFEDLQAGGFDKSDSTATWREVAGQLHRIVETTRDKTNRDGTHTMSASVSIKRLTPRCTLHKISGAALRKLRRKPGGRKFPVPPAPVTEPWPPKDVLNP